MSYYRMLSREEEQAKGEIQQILEMNVMLKNSFLEVL